MCDKGANAFLEQYFRDCIYNTRDMTGFCLGMASIGCWLVAQLPQIISNIRTQSVEALSPWFLAEWLLGDTCNLIGCILSGTQLPTQLYSAMYFIVMDCIMVVQYVWYGTIQKRKERRMSSSLRRSTDQPEAVILENEEVVNNGAGQLSATHNRPGAKARVLACAALVVLAQSQWPGQPGSVLTALRQRDQHTLPLHPFLPQHSIGARPAARRLLWSVPAEALQWQWHPQWTLVAGSVIGYLSTCFYLGSRVSQIFKNWRRGSAEGLAIAMFLCAIAANVLYGVGILIRSYSRAEVLASAPWILGSLGTVGLDVIIYLQWQYYMQLRDKPPEGEALLGGSGSSSHHQT